MQNRAEMLQFFFFFLTGEYADPNLVTLAQHSNTSDQWLQLRRIFLLCAF